MYHAMYHCKPRLTLNGPGVHMRSRNEESVDVQSRKAHQVQTEMTKHDIIKAFCVGYGCDGAGGGHQGLSGLGVDLTACGRCQSMSIAIRD